LKTTWRKSLVEIVKVKGKMVPGLGNCNGRRAQKTGVNWGGRQTKGARKQFRNLGHLHPDTREAWSERKAAVYVLKVDKTTKLESFVLQDGTGTSADSQYIQLSPEGKSKVGKNDNVNAQKSKVKVEEMLTESGRCI
jgi:hypothetical protein